MKDQANFGEVVFTLLACLLFTYGALAGNPLVVIFATIPAALAIVLADVSNN